MSEKMKQAIQGAVEAISALKPENQSHVAKYAASVMDAAMDMAEQIAPILAVNQRESQK